MYIPWNQFYLEDIGRRPTTKDDISGHADVFTLVNRYAHPQEYKVIDLTNEIADVLTGKLQESHSLSPLFFNALKAIDSSKSCNFDPSSNKRKTPKAWFLKSRGVGGISRTRTYDPHDVNVVL